MKPRLVTERMRRPLWVWCAVLLALWLGAGPALLHAGPYTGVQGTDRMEICTALGTQIVDVYDAEVAGPASGKPLPASAPHCPFCLHAADRQVPPPHLLPYLFLVQGGPQELPDWQAFFYFHSTPVWAPPRGPPAAV